MCVIISSRHDTQSSVSIVHPRSVFGVILMTKKQSDGGRDQEMESKFDYQNLVNSGDKIDQFRLTIELLVNMNERRW